MNLNFAKKINKDSLRKILGWTLLTSPLTTSVIYDMYGNYKYIKPATEAIRLDNTPIGPIPDEIELIGTKKKASKWLENKLNFDSPLFKNVAKEQFDDMLDSANNAAFILPEHKEGTPAIILPKKIGGKVLAHEIGHYLDSVSRKVKTEEQFTKKIEEDGIGVLKTLFMDPKKSGIYKAELKAWKKTNIPKDDPLREKALKSYEFGLKSHRPFFYSLPLAGIGLGLLTKKI